MLLVGIVKKNLSYYVINKSWIYHSFTSNKANNLVFIIFWEHKCSTNETHCHIWWQSKLYIFIKEPLSCSHEAYQDSSSFGARKDLRKLS
jgi:hypothetical protein